MLETSKQIELPSQFEGFRKQIECSLLSSYHIESIIKKTKLEESKFSGIPYLPKCQRFPKDRDGNFMKLLAQINFFHSNMSPPFPRQGILQFFISNCKQLTTYPIEESINQHYFKVRYYPNINTYDQLIEDFTYLIPGIDSLFPITSEMGLTFVHKLEPVSATDYRREHYLNKVLFEKFNANDDGRTLEDLYIERFLGAEHKLGGYPYFIYSDPRNNSPLLQTYDTLLLQIVSNDEQGIMWGDTGILKFFINKNKLLQLDFTDVYFVAEQY